jgi:uncharacterized membrane protein YqiK
MDLWTGLLLLAEGRGSNPSGGGGVWIVVGIVVAVAIGGFVLHWLFDRFYRSKGRQAEIFEREPQRKGRAGRIH